MKALFIKELKGFFSSVTGSLVIIVFLLLNSTFMWVFRGGYNVMDTGYASLSALFDLAPWVFLFLVPAITMRMFAEEKRAGTLEVLYTRPITEWQIALAKFFASWFLVFVSLLPTLIYFYSVWMLGNPRGNLDSGAALGSYLGLIFLGGIYTSTGIFSSSLSQNPVVAFIVAVVLCFFLYLGFEFLSYVAGNGNIVNLIRKTGIDYHYVSVSRGVVDSRDLIYFFSVIFLFLYLTRFVILSRKW